MNDDIRDESVLDKMTMGIISSEELEDAERSIRELHSETHLVSIMILQASARIDQHEAACLDLYDQVEATAAKVKAQPEAAHDLRRLTVAAHQLLTEQAGSHDITRNLLKQTHARLARSAVTSEQLQEVLKRIARTA